MDGTGPSNRAIRDRILGAGYTISSFAVRQDGARRIESHLEWYSAEAQDQAPDLVEQLANDAGILAVEWMPISAGHLFE